MSSVVMRDPVVAADGLSYERRFIERWLRDGNRASPVTREPLAFPHLYPNQHLRTLIQRRGAPPVPAVAFASPDERRTAEVEWFVAKPGRGGYGVAKGERDGAIFFAESTVRDEGVPASGRKITYKVEANEPLVSVGARTTSEPWTWRSCRSGSRLLLEIGLLSTRENASGARARGFLISASAATCDPTMPVSRRVDGVEVDTMIQHEGREHLISAQARIVFPICTGFIATHYSADAVFAVLAGLLGVTLTILLVFREAFREAIA